MVGVTRPITGNSGIVYRISETIKLILSYAKLLLKIGSIVRMSFRKLIYLIKSFRTWFFYR